MLTKFQNYIHHHKLVTPHDKILVAVSGGLDSMVMLRLFQQAGHAIAVAHCNFGLRGAASDGDETFVRNKCAQAGVLFFAKRFETNNYADAHGVSIQMAARSLRYSWFDELMNTEGFTKLATAHHLQDSLETVLLNFSRGAGLEGMQGIVPASGKRIRPLLFASKQEIENFAAAEQIKWREDESNRSDDYQRNFIRHHILPQLKVLNPSLLETFLDYQLKLAAAQELMHQGVVEWKQNFWTESKGKIRISKEGLTSANAAGLLWEVLKSYGFHLDQFRELVAALPSQSGKRFSSDRFEIFIDRLEIILTPILEPFDAEVLIEKSVPVATLGKLQLFISTKNSFQKTTEREIACLDAEKIQFPLVWRKWRYGDSFFPLGMPHRKKISDFLIDQKISLPDKQKVTVLESSGEIIWVVGHRIDDRFKITEATRSFLELSISTIK